MPHGPQSSFRPSASSATLNATNSGFSDEKKMAYTRPASSASAFKPAPLNSSHLDMKSTNTVNGTDLHVSPHGTVRAMPRGATAPSGTLKSLNGETVGMATQMAPLQHSLPPAPPIRSGDVLVVDSQPVTKWDMGPQNRMRPITFKSSGSFKTLKETGKLSGTSFQNSAPSALKMERESYIPGYTGYIRGKQHIAGRTYGEATRRALTRDYREMVCTSPIPSNPTANRKVSHFREDESFVSNTFASKTYHVPGYTGFVPGVRQTFSKSYGSITSSELQKHYAQHGMNRLPRTDTGFAETQRTRQALPLDSASLPGAIKTHKPPEKLIPAHLKNVRFLAY